MNPYSSKRIPFGQLGLVVLESCTELGSSINRHLLEKKENQFEVEFSGDENYAESCLIPVKQVRFSNGEGKIKLEDTARGKDIYILCDVGNYSCTYNMYGFKNHMGPDEHLQDIKRVLSAIGGKARRVTVVMPLLFASRQHRRKGRESLDCAIALQELERLGVQNIITFDAHDPNVQNCIPLISFDNIYPTYEIIKAFLESEENLYIDKSSMLVISPDTGAMDRAIYYAGILGLDVGLFYKRRDHSKVVGGKNPIVQHEYIGRDVEGQDVLIIDDMIASGESIFDIAKELKKRNVRRIFVAATFALFTEGVEKFNKYYEDGLFDKIYSTNLTYCPEEVSTARWFHQVDMSGFIANIIDSLNYDESIKPLLAEPESITELLKKHKGE
jgi:ribose-phosphate pyrophosphokinase